MKTAGFDAESQLKDSREAYGQHLRAPTSGGGRRVGVGAGGNRPPLLVDLDAQQLNPRQRRAEPMTWHMQNEAMDQDINIHTSKGDSQILS